MRVCVIVLLSLVSAAIWVAAVYVTYQDRKRLRMEESIVHPGMVNYASNNTQSRVVQLPRIEHNNTPVISGDEVRQYARTGHGGMSEEQSLKPMYEQSSARVRDMGPGGVVSPSGNETSTSSSSSRGIIYANTAVAMPFPNRGSSLIARVSDHSEHTRAGVSTRKAMPGYKGEDGDWINGGEGDWWYYDEDHWRNPLSGETRFDPTLSYVVVWNGAEWVKQTEYDPGLPVGDVPWMYVLFLCGIICIIKKNNVLLQPNSKRYEADI